MSRRYPPSGYDDPRESDQRNSRDQDEIRDPRNLQGVSGRRTTGEQPLIRDLRQSRDPREPKQYHDAPEADERADIRISRGNRESRDVAGFRDESDQAGKRPIREQETRYRGSSRASTASRETRGGHQDRRYTRDKRYSQANPSLRDNRDDRGGRYHERRDQRPRQPRPGDEFMRQNPRDIQQSQDPASSPVQSRHLEYFVPESGIRLEVAEAKIPGLLGPEAKIRPGMNKQGRQGYIIRAHSILTTGQIQDLITQSSLWEEQNLERRRVSSVPQQTLRPQNIGDRGDLHPHSGRPVPADPRQTQAYPPTGMYPPTQAYPPRRDSRQDYSSRGPVVDPRLAANNREGSSQSGEVIDRDGHSEYGGSSRSRSTGNSRLWDGSQDPLSPSLSSRSTAPSSVQGHSDRQRGFMSPDTGLSSPIGSPTPYLRHPAAQGQPRASLSDAGHIYGGRVGQSGRSGARDRLGRLAEEEPDDDPPDWDETPYFKEVRSPPGRHLHETPGVPAHGPLPARSRPQVFESADDVYTEKHRTHR